MIQLRRVYGEPGAHEGVRFLVERLWPRGIRKTELQLDGWQKEAGPRTASSRFFTASSVRSRLKRQPAAIRRKGWRPVAHLAAR